MDHSDNAPNNAENGEEINRPPSAELPDVVPEQNPQRIGEPIEFIEVEMGENPFAQLGGEEEAVKVDFRANNRFNMDVMAARMAVRNGYRFDYPPGRSTRVRSLTDPRPSTLKIPNVSLPFYYFRYDPTQSDDENSKEMYGRLLTYTVKKHDYAEQAWAYHDELKKKQEQEEKERLEREEKEIAREVPDDDTSSDGGACSSASSSRSNSSDY